MSARSEFERKHIDIAHYVDQRLADHRNLHAVEQTALMAASEAMQARFESVNEFRGTLSDQVGTFVTRDTLDVLMRGRDERLEQVDSRIRDLTSQVARTAILSGTAAGIITGVAGYVLGQL